MNKNLTRIISIIILIIYLSSLTMESYLVNGKPSIGSFGLIAFLLGWLNFNLIGIIWLANPLFIISLLLLFLSKKKDLAIILSLISSTLAISFTQIQEIIRNEAGQIGDITEYLTGYWIWLSAIFMMLITSILNKMLNKKTMHNSGYKK